MCSVVNISSVQGQAGFKSLPPLMEGAAPGAQGWRREAAADSATSETQWLERQEAVLKAAQVTHQALNMLIH